jgi:hypothetical protein
MEKRAVIPPRAETGGAAGSNVDKLVFRFAGVLILVSLALSQLHSPYWLWLTAFVGANMLQASFTGFCPLATLLAKLGVRPGAAFCSARRSA